MDAPRSEFDDLGPLEPESLAGLAAVVLAGAWLARRDLRALARLCVLPIALLLVDVCIKAGWSDVLASRWSGLRHVYVPAAFLALGSAWCLRQADRAASILASILVAVVGAAVLAWAASSSWRLAERTWERMADDERALSAAVAKLRPLALTPGSTAYLLEVGDARPFSMWQGALRDRVGGVRFVVVTHDGAPGPGTQSSSIGPRSLALEIEAAHADFLRPERQPSWAGPIEPEESFALYLRRGGQLNTWPIFDRGVLDGRAVALPGIDGANVRVQSLEHGRPVRLVLETRHPLDDPRTVLLIERQDGWVRVPP